MKEYIEKSVLIAMCKGIAACDWNKKVAPVSWADAYERFADEVEDFDAADVVERKRGEWIWDSRFSDYTCSECHNWDLKTPNFCSNCGADMRGEKHEP